MALTHDPTDTPEDSGCTVIQASLKEAGRRRARSRDLPDELRALKEQRGLPGIAICFVGYSERLRVIPGPLRLPFEPVALEDAFGLLRLLHEQGDPRGYSSEEQHEALTRRLKWLYWPLSAWFIANAWLRDQKLFVTVLGISVILAAIGAQSVGLVLHAAVLVIGAFFLALLAFAVIWAYQRWKAGQWFLIPGGVVIRYNAPTARRYRLERYTPEDAILVVEEDLGGFVARLWQDDRCKERLTNETECVALLAAWQSPLRSPGIDEMPDLK